MIKATLKFSFNKKIPRLIREATKNGLARASVAVEKTAKIITTEEDHVITGRFRSSINLNGIDGVSRSTVSETQSGDGIHEFIEDLKLRTGSNVEYAAHLERSYSIFARAMDMSKGDMNLAFTKGVREYLSSHT